MHASMTTFEWMTILLTLVALILEERRHKKEGEERQHKKENEKCKHKKEDKEHRHRKGDKD